MLQSLTIRNIALIEELTVSFHDGLHVLSGETGAGKSIVVDAVNLVLGGRADRELIRTGTEKASVEAIFDTSGQPKIAQLLDEQGIEYDGGTVILYREITASGRNICRVCGVVTSVNTIRQVSALLMDIHGQHEHQFLMDSAYHMDYLDRTGDEKHRKLIDETAAAFYAFQENHRAYARMKKQNENRQRDMEKLKEDLDLLQHARLKNGEEETLQAELERMHHSEKIAEALRSSWEITASSETDFNVLSMMRDAGNALRSVADLGEDLADISTQYDNCYYELQELAYTLRSLADRADSDPEGVEKAEARMDLIRKLERRYGTTVEEVLEQQHEMEARYEELVHLDEKLDELAAEDKRLLKDYRVKAQTLTQARQKLAHCFEQNMMRELRELGMAATVFKVAFAAKEDGKPRIPTVHGDDDVSFMISPNPGEPLKALARIASGGELSRLMLAIKRLEADNAGVGTMVFDEIDTGISGRMAQVVAEKMRQISHTHQVICVTHLPQIAAAADHEYMVAKEVRNGRTNTDVTELDREGHIREVARMISGAEGVGDNAIRYAVTMINAMQI